MIFGRKKIPSFANYSDSKSAETGVNSRKTEIQNIGDMEFSFLKDRFEFGVLIFFIFSILLEAAIILFSFKKLPPQLPLFYSRPWGEQILASPLFLWILPAVILVFSVLNFWILTQMKEGFFLRRVLMVFTLIVSLVLNYALWRLINLLI